MNAHIRYECHLTNVKRKVGSLVDRGAHGGILGSDALIIFQHQRWINVTGIDNREMDKLCIVDATALAMSNKRLVILLLQQYACLGTGRTIHSVPKMEHAGNLANDRSLKVEGGRQCIQCLDGYILPLDIHNGLPYLPMTACDLKLMNKYPHIRLTSGKFWDPTVLDNNFSDQQDWVNTVADLDKGIIQTPLMNEVTSRPVPFRKTGRPFLTLSRHLLNPSKRRLISSITSIP